MANISIDDVVVAQLIAARHALIAVVNAGITAVMPGEPEPNSEAWCRLVAWKMKPRRRQRSDIEPDLADLEIALFCGVSPAKVIQHATALQTVEAAARLAYADQTVQDPAAPAAAVHQVELYGAEFLGAEDPDPERGFRCSLGTVRGIAQRWSGSTLIDHLVP